MAQIQSGAIYRIFNAKAEQNVIDLSGTDQQSIIGWPAHDGDNQKWHIEETNGLYTFRNVRYGKYITLMETPRDGVPAKATDFTFEWEIRPDNEDPGVFRIFAPGTPFNLDLTNFGSGLGNTPIAVWGKWEGRNQCWRFEQI